MQRRLRNTLAIAIAGGAVILGTGTAFAATPDLPATDDVAGTVSKTADKGGDDGKEHKGDKKKSDAPTDTLGGAGLPDASSLTGNLPALTG
ncbi:hypothetical protein [Pseudonocardia acaciae]|uniref:hypothetical protein n=1 Tax=Pseudonocardia acaciae TaxID=551276 RepID=UPI00048DE5A5|nr:hypothetical protein [Pseudonocardia acaciae]